MSFATWNIKGLRTKQTEVIREITKFNLDIVALTETKKKGSGNEIIENYVHFYSGVKKENRAKAGVSLLIAKKYRSCIKDWAAISERILKVEIKVKGYDVVIVAIYAPSNDDTVAVKDEYQHSLEQVLDRIGNRKEILCLGDFNAHTGSEIDDVAIGPFGDSTLNDNGLRLKELCYNYSLRVQNGFFQHRDIHKYTWVQPSRNLKSIIDYVISKQTTRLKFYDVRALRGLECGTDHYVVRATVFFPWAKPKATILQQNGEQTVCESKYNLESLNDESTAHLYRRRLDEKIGNIPYTSPVDMYNSVLICVREAALEALGRFEVTYKKTNDWWNPNTEELVKEKKKAYSKWLTTKDNEDRRDYMRCCREVKRAVVLAKNEIWDKRCHNIDHYIGHSRSTEAWRTLKSLRMDRRENVAVNWIPIEEWKNYHRNLLTEDREDFLKLDDMVENMDISYAEDDMISYTEIKKTVRTMKNKRASGPNGIPIELLKNGTNDLWCILSYVFSCFLRGDDLPKEWKTAYISNLYKKGDRKMCSNYRGLSVTNSVCRLYSKIIKQRIESQVEDVEEQNGFRAGRSCSDNIFCLKQLIEKRSERNLETHLIFIDLQKAYDSIPLGRLWPVLRQSGVKDLYVQAVKELYTDTTARIKIGKELSSEFSISKGLRQGCPIAPTLFKIYLAAALDKWRRACCSMGISIGNDKLFTLHFADDQVIMAEDEDDVYYMIRKLDEEYRKWGLTINVSKTEYMVINGTSSHLALDGGVIEAVDTYKYLGVTFAKKSSTETEIRKRIGQGRAITKQLNGVLWNSQIRPVTKRRIYKTIVESVATYGAEVWDMTQQLKNKLKAMEMTFWRRSCKLTLLDRVRNEEIRTRMGVSTSIIDTIEAKGLRWYGHVRRMDEKRWPKRMLEWIPPQRRKRGRPKNTWKKGIEEAMQERGLQEGDWQDRTLWKLRCDKRQ